MGRSMRKSGFFDPDTLTLLYRASMKPGSRLPETIKPPK